jgi:hypothetical protein
MTKHLILSAMAAIALGAGLASAAPAQADTQDYLTWLQNHGVSGPLANGMDLESAGSMECAGLRAGRPEKFLIDNLEGVGIGIAPAEDVVYAAHHYLCPGA